MKKIYYSWFKTKFNRQDSWKRFNYISFEIKKSSSNARNLVYSKEIFAKEHAKLSKIARFLKSLADLRTIITCGNSLGHEKKRNITRNSHPRISTTAKVVEIIILSSLSWCWDFNSLTSRKWHPDIITDLNSFSLNVEIYQKNVVSTVKEFFLNIIRPWGEDYKNS